MRTPAEIEADAEKERRERVAATLSFMFSAGGDSAEDAAAKATLILYGLLD